MHQARSIRLAAALACGFATGAAAEVRIDGTAAALHHRAGFDRRRAHCVRPEPQAQIPRGRSARCCRQRGLFRLARTGARAPARRLQLHRQARSGRNRGRGAGPARRRRDPTGAPAPGPSKGVASRWR